MNIFGRIRTWKYNDERCSANFRNYHTMLLFVSSFVFVKNVLPRNLELKNKNQLAVSDAKHLLFRPAIDGPNNITNRKSCAQSD